MVRTGAASPELIKLIEQYFNALDDDNSGTLSIDEILKNRDEANAVAEKLIDQVSHHAEKESEVIHTAVTQQKKRQAQKRASIVEIALQSTIEHVREVTHQENPMISENDSKGVGCNEDDSRL
jgi:hypothetical protein